MRPGTFQVATPALTVSESAGAVDVPVDRTDGTDGPVVVPYTISPATTAGLSSINSGSISFAANETSRTIHVPITNDSVYEGDRTFVIALGNPGGAAILGNSSTTTVSILEDDPLPSIAISDTSVVESNTTAVVTLSLSNASAFPVTVAYTTIDGTAKAGSDYAAASGAIVFPPGTLQQWVNIPILDDSVVEGTESFAIALSSAEGGTLSRSSAVVQIADNDTDLQLTMTSANSSVVTATHATFVLDVRNIGPGTARNVQLSLPVPAGATLVSATAANGSCTGVTTVVCTVPTIADHADDAITLVLNAPSVRGSMALSATVAQDGTDPNPANNTASSAVAVLAPEQVPAASGIVLLTLVLAIGAIGAFRLP